MKVPRATLADLDADVKARVLERLNDLDPGLYTAHADTGANGYRTLSAALADALGWARPAGYETMVSRILNEADALVVPTAEAFELNEPATHALRALSTELPVLLLGPTPPLRDLEPTDVTRDLDLPTPPDAVPMAEGSTTVVLNDPRTATKGAAAGALLILAARATTAAPDEFWTLTALGLAVLALTRMG